MNDYGVFATTTQGAASFVILWTPTHPFITRPLPGGGGRTGDGAEGTDGRGSDERRTYGTCETGVGRIAHGRLTI